MNPNYVHTITLYRKQADGTFKRSVLKNCFFKAETTVVQSGTNVSKVNTYTVRIPADKAGKNFSVTTGSDIVILGECKETISDTKGNRAAELLLRYKPMAFKVTAFSDNTSHRLDKHYRLGG